MEVEVEMVEMNKLVKNELMSSLLETGKEKLISQVIDLIASYNPHCTPIVNYLVEPIESIDDIEPILGVGSDNIVISLKTNNDIFYRGKLSDAIDCYNQCCANKFTGSRSENGTIENTNYSIMLFICFIKFPADYLSANSLHDPSIPRFLSEFTPPTVNKVTCKYDLLASCFTINISMNK